MKTVIYHNPKCSTSRNALGILNEKGEDVEIVEYLKDVPSEKDLRELIKKLNIKPELLIRKKESVFKEQFSNQNYSDDEWIQIMHQHPILIERPIIIKGKKAIIGRPLQHIVDIL
jgi:arsenate reductase